ncbi:MAG: hypothetical protein EBS06_05500 [Proteobacteria bacterium]|nr:hypothetical protein [Pseudomonadota bacterium]
MTTETSPELSKWRLAFKYLKEHPYFIPSLIAVTFGVISVAFFYFFGKPLADALIPLIENYLKGHVSIN